jgi:hypothetical protein
MDISANSAVSSVLEQRQSAQLQQVQVSMFKKALDMNSQGALALISSASNGSVTMPSVTNNPPNLGQNVDVMV